MPLRRINHDEMKYLPVLIRQDITSQVNLEGSLATTDGAAPMSYSSTGSTGTPVKVYISPQNGYYNKVRYLAKFFINDLSLDENHTKVGSAITLQLFETGKPVKMTASWAGSLSGVFRNGSSTQILHTNDDQALMDELSRHRVGYLVCHSRIVEILLERGGIEFLKKLGLAFLFSRFRLPRS
jgi:phenylacetate-coenzyme A ligase PaaK-like adenylate-forming protein